jgi:hypothetical protein
MKGILTASEVRIEVQTADFVFETDYELRPLNEVETYIKNNRHLPDVPSAAQMKEDGVGVVEMNKLLLQKIEELTLYIIGQEKRILELETKLNH